MIQTHGLAMRFPNETAIAYKDLTFYDNESYVLLGASGCGKSTLLNMISGVLTPTEGRILVDGRDMTAETQRARDRFRVESVGYIFQDFKLIEEMTVEDNIRVLELEGVDVSGMRDMLAALGIEKLRRRRVQRLSGGEKQRVAIARALIKRPRIVLADEPTGNLNYEIGREVVKLLTDRAKGMCVIAVTHDDRLAGMFDHRIDMKDVILPARAENAGEAR